MPFKVLYKQLIKQRDLANKGEMALKANTHNFEIKTN